MAEAKRWPVNANKARMHAMDAAEETIDEATAGLVGLALDDKEKVAASFSRIIHLANDQVRVLIAAKYGEAPGQEAEEVGKEET